MCNRYLGHGGTSTQKRVKFYDKFLTIERCFHVIGFTPQVNTIMVVVITHAMFALQVVLESDLAISTTQCSKYSTN